MAMGGGLAEPKHPQLPLQMAVMPSRWADFAIVAARTARKTASRKDAVNRASFGERNMTRAAANSAPDEEAEPHLQPPAEIADPERAGRDLHEIEDRLGEQCRVEGAELHGRAGEHPERDDDANEDRAGERAVAAAGCGDRGVAHGVSGSGSNCSQQACIRNWWISWIAALSRPGR